MADKAGRPVSTKDYFKILLRLPPDLQARVERCHALLQRQHGPKFTQTQALWHLLESGCSVVEGTIGGTERPASVSVSEISEISPVQILKISEISGEDAGVPGYGFPEDEDTRTPLPNGAPKEPHGGAVAQSRAGDTATGTAPRQGASSTPVLELSEDIVKIAEARAQYDRISERAFADLLFERGIYRHRAKDGQEVPIPHTTLRTWLQRAQDAGML